MVLYNQRSISSNVLFFHIFTYFIKTCSFSAFLFRIIKFIFCKVSKLMSNWQWLIYSLGLSVISGQLRSRFLKCSFHFWSQQKKLSLLLIQLRMYKHWIILKINYNCKIFNLQILLIFYEYYIVTKDITIGPCEYLCT